MNLWAFVIASAPDEHRRSQEGMSANKAQATSYAFGIQFIHYVKTSATVSSQLTTRNTSSAGTTIHCYRHMDVVALSRLILGVTSEWDEDQQCDPNAHVGAKRELCKWPHERAEVDNAMPYLPHIQLPYLANRRGEWVETTHNDLRVAR